MTIECFVLLLIMMNSQQGLTGRDRDIDEFIKQEKDNPNFKEMFNKIMEGGTSTKKVDNFLGGDQMIAGMTPSYFGVPESVREANKFMSRYTKGDFSDPEFIRNFKIIQEYNKGQV